MEITLDNFVEDGAGSVREESPADLLEGIEKIVADGVRGKATTDLLAGIAQVVADVVRGKATIDLLADIAHVVAGADRGKAATDLLADIAQVVADHVSNDSAVVTGVDIMKDMVDKSASAETFKKIDELSARLAAADGDEEEIQKALDETKKLVDDDKASFDYPAMVQALLEHVAVARTSAYMLEKHHNTLAAVVGLTSDALAETMDAVEDLTEAGSKDFDTFSEEVETLHEAVEETSNDGVSMFNHVSGFSAVQSGMLGMSILMLQEQNKAIAAKLGLDLESIRFDPKSEEYGFMQEFANTVAEGMENIADTLLENVDTLTPEGKELSNMVEDTVEVCTDMASDVPLSAYSLHGPVQTLTVLTGIIAKSTAMAWDEDADEDEDDPLEVYAAVGGEETNLVLLGEDYVVVDFSTDVDAGDEEAWVEAMTYLVDNNLYVKNSFGAHVELMDVINNVRGDELVGNSPNFPDAPTDLSVELFEAILAGKPFQYNLRGIVDLAELILSMRTFLGKNGVLA